VVLFPVFNIVEKRGKAAGKKGSISSEKGSGGGKVVTPAEGIGAAPR